MFSSLCWKSAERSFLKHLTPVIAQTIAPYNIYSIKFRKCSFRVIKLKLTTCRKNAAKLRMRTKKRSGATGYAANCSWGNKVKKEPLQVPCLSYQGQNSRYNLWIRNQFCGKGGLCRYCLRVKRIISLQQLGEIIKTTSEHTRSFCGVCVSLSTKKGMALEGKYFSRGDNLGYPEKCIQFSVGKMKKKCIFMPSF